MIMLIFLVLFVIVIFIFFRRVLRGICLVGNFVVIEVIGMLGRFVVLRYFI